MRPYLPALLFFVLFVVFVSTTQYIANSNYRRGYLSAETQGLAQISKLKKQHSQALANQYQAYLAKLERAQQRANDADKNHLTKQAKLNKQLQRLQGELHEALRHQPECTFTVQWVQHYQAALGLPTDDRGNATAANTAKPVTKNTAAADAETLLQHAEQYGHWCQSAVARLDDLQLLIIGANNEQTY